MGGYVNLLVVDQLARFCRNDCLAARRIDPRGSRAGSSGADLDLEDFDPIAVAKA